MKAVSDSSPLIALARIGRLDLLSSLFDRIFVPSAVYEEVVVAGAGLPGAEQVRQTPWIEVVNAPDVADMSLLRQCVGLGAGEKESISLAEHLSADVVLLDEARARRVAHTAGLTVTGCIGKLESGFRRDLVQDLRAAYVDLLKQGIRFDLRLLSDSLAKFDLPTL